MKNGNPLQYSCLENPSDRGARWAPVRGVARSRTRLSDWAQYQHSLFPGCSILPFPCASVCHFSLLVLHNVFLSFLFFVSYLCSRFIAYGYHEVYIKCLTDKIVLFLLTSSYLHLSRQVPSFSSSSLVFLLSQNAPFHVVNLLPNWGSYSCFYCFFSQFPLHTINKCLKICCDKELQFSDSVCQYITFLSFVYFCFFVSGRRALLTFLIRIMLMASFSFCLSGKAFISPSYLNDNVAG